MGQIDALLAARIAAPGSPVNHGALVWDSGTSSWKSATGGDGSGAHFLADDGTYKSVASGAIAPAHLIGAVSSVASGNAATGANSVWLVPVAGVSGPSIAVSRLAVYDNVAGGTLDVGLFHSDDEATFTRDFSTGATYTLTAAGNVTIALGSKTFTPVTGRRWYVACALSGAGSLFGSTSGPSLAYTKAAVGSTLPATLTGMTATRQAFDFVLAV